MTERCVFVQQRLQLFLHRGGGGWVEKGWGVGGIGGGLEPCSTSLMWAARARAPSESGGVQAGPEPENTLVREKQSAADQIT